MTQFLIIISTAREQNVSYLQNGTSYAWIIFGCLTVWMLDQIPSARTKKPAEGKHLIEASIIVFIICIFGLEIY